MPVVFFLLSLLSVICWPFVGAPSGGRRSARLFLGHNHDWRTWAIRSAVGVACGPLLNSAGTTQSGERVTRSLVCSNPVKTQSCILLLSGIPQEAVRESRLTLESKWLSPSPSMMKPAIVLVHPLVNVAVCPSSDRHCCFRASSSAGGKRSMQVHRKD